MTKARRRHRTTQPDGVGGRRRRVKDADHPGRHREHARRMKVLRELRMRDLVVPPRVDRGLRRLLLDQLGHARITVSPGTKWNARTAPPSNEGNFQARARLACRCAARDPRAQGGIESCLKRPDNLPQRRIFARARRRQTARIKNHWRSGRVVEGSGFENRRWGNSTRGSNPFSSAEFAANPFVPPPGGRGLAGRCRTDWDVPGGDAVETGRPDRGRREAACCSPAARRIAPALPGCRSRGAHGRARTCRAALPSIAFTRSGVSGLLCGRRFTRFRSITTFASKASR